MVRDRMPDLCANRKSEPFSKGLFQDVCIQMVQNKQVREILEDAEKIRKMIELLQENVNIIKDLHNNNLSHTNADIQTELEGRTFVVSQTAVRIRNDLQKLNINVSKMNEVSMDSAREGPIHVRIRTLQYLTMLQILSATMQDYNDSLTRYHAKRSFILRRQKSIIRQENDGLNSFEEEDDINEKSLFIDNILDESRTARLELSELRSRHDELIKLEKSLVEIRDMVSELAFAVEKQGEQLNCVEYFAGQASGHVDSGRCDISKAETRRTKNRMRKIKCGSFLAILILFLLLIGVFL